MLDNNYYVYKKEVDWSLLHRVNHPVTIQVVFHNAVNKFLPRGKSTDIYLVLEGKTYRAELVNQENLMRKNIPTERISCK